MYVTHDQKEALSISDRMAILDAGRIVQVGTPRQVYRRPVNRAVADFMGDADFIAGQVVSTDGERAVVETAVGRFEGVLGRAAQIRKGSAATVSIRPECWRLGAGPGPENSVRGRVGETVFLGETAQVAFRTGELALRVLELNPGATGALERGEVFASVAPEDAVILTE